MTECEMCDAAVSEEGFKAQHVFTPAGAKSTSRLNFGNPQAADRTNQTRAYVYLQGKK